VVSVPYTLEINDVAITAVQGHRSDEIFLRGVDHFDRLYQEGADQPRVMAISIHPYLTGAPHRTGRGSNPLDRDERFQVTSPSSSPELTLTQGSSTPSGPSVARRRCWPVCRATPTASPSPTAG